MTTKDDPIMPIARRKTRNVVSLSASIRALEIFKAVIDDNAGNIFTRVTGEEANLGELASERNELAPKQAAALAERHFREGESEVAQPDATQASVKLVDG